MPAPSLRALHSFESQFHYAVQSILKDAGFNPVYINGDRDMNGQRVAIPDSCTLIKFRREGALTDDRTKRPNGKLEFYRYVGTLEINSRIRAEDNVPSKVVGCATILDERCGLVRELMLRSEGKFTLGKLPWLGISEIEPLTPSHGVDDSANAARDAFSESWRITFEILPDAWPS